MLMKRYEEEDRRRDGVCDNKWYKGCEGKWEIELNGIVWREGEEEKEYVKFTILVSMFISDLVDLYQENIPYNINVLQLILYKSL